MALNVHHHSSCAGKGQDSPPSRVLAQVSAHRAFLSSLPALHPLSRLQLSNFGDSPPPAALELWELWASPRPGTHCPALPSPQPYSLGSLVPCLPRPVHQGEEHLGHAGNPGEASRLVLSSLLSLPSHPTHAKSATWELAPVALGSYARISSRGLRNPHAFFPNASCSRGSPCGATSPNPGCVVPTLSPPRSHRQVGRTPAPGPAARSRQRANRSEGWRTRPCANSRPPARRLGPARAKRGCS